MGLRPTIVPTFAPQTPLGAGLSNLAQIFTAGPSPYEMQANQALIDARNAQARKTGLEADNLAAGRAALDSFQSLFEQAYAPPPQIQVDDPLGGSGEIPDPTFSRNEQVLSVLPKLAGAIAQSGKLTDIGKIMLAMTANAPGVSDDVVTRALVGSGKALGENDAVSTGMQDRVSARNAAESKDQALAAVVSGRTPRNYITPDGAQGVTLDGTTDAADGSPIPKGSQVSTAQIGTDDAGKLTAATKTKMQGDAIELGRFRDLSARARKIAEADPASFGLAGNVRRFLQEAGQQVAMLRTLAGDNYESVLAEAEADLSAAGVDPAYYNTDLSNIEKIATLLAYQGAAAIAGQSGRGLSDRDFKVLRGAIGDPTAFLASQASFLSGLDMLDNIVETRIQAAGSEPAPAGPAAPQQKPGGGTVEKWTRGADGRLVPAGR